MPRRCWLGRARSSLRPSTDQTGGAVLQRSQQRRPRQLVRVLVQYSTVPSVCLGVPCASQPYGARRSLFPRPPPPTPGAFARAVRAGVRPVAQGAARTGTVLYEKLYVRTEYGVSRSTRHGGGRRARAADTIQYSTRPRAWLWLPGPPLGARRTFSCAGPWRMVPAGALQDHAADGRTLVRWMVTESYPAFLLGALPPPRVPAWRRVRADALGPPCDVER